MKNQTAVKPNVLILNLAAVSFATTASEQMQTALHQLGYNNANGSPELLDINKPLVIVNLADKTIDVADKVPTLPNGSFAPFTEFAPTTDDGGPAKQFIAMAHDATFVEREEAGHKVTVCGAGHIHAIDGKPTGQGRTNRRGESPLVALMMLAALAGGLRQQPVRRATDESLGAASVSQ